MKNRYLPFLLLQLSLTMVSVTVSLAEEMDGIAAAELGILQDPSGIYDYLVYVAENQDTGAQIRVRVDEIGRSQQGQPICMVTITGAGGGRENPGGGLMVVARQHGDEPAGTAAMVELVRRLVTEPDGALIDAIEGSALRIVPIANPDGARAFRRRTANNADMNRDWNSLRLPETRAVKTVISRFMPDVLLDLHEMTPRDGGDYHMVGLPLHKASDLLWTVKRALTAESLPARTLARESSRSTALLHRDFAAGYGRAALLVESRYTSDPLEELDRRAEYHITVVTAAMKELGGKEILSSQATAHRDLSTASATRRN